jgi:hypothetical protein
MSNPAISLDYTAEIERQRARTTGARSEATGIRALLRRNRRVTVGAALVFAAAGIANLCLLVLTQGWTPSGPLGF